VISSSLRVVHYVNQFFGGIGGEEKAGERPRVEDGPVGPGKAVQNALGERGEVVATIICGDNYFSERTDEATQEIIQLLTPYRPDMVIAGPAFNAGRYGVACGALCKAVQDKLGIPAVTGMYEENPGVDLYKRDVYIVKTANSAKAVTQDTSKMVNIALKLLTKESIGKPAEEGYLPRGILGTEFSDRNAAERAVSMVLAKIKGETFKSEIEMPKFRRIKPAPPIKDLTSAKIALVTDGGLYPKGNPDNMSLHLSTKFGKYSIKSVDKLDAGDYEVVHSGYDNHAINQDPNRIIALDVMRDLETEGKIGKLCEYFYATSGCGTTIENSARMGQEIAEQLKAERVDGVILTST